MARIRSIKPEFPQSETVGRLSRDARLLFVQLWTIADDAGRARGASRMLASLLYPYDDDAPSLIIDWLTELEAKECIRRYEVDGAQYIEIVNWLKHQKIDRPSESRLPPYREGSTNAREHSRGLDADLGPRTETKDQDQEDTSLRSVALPAVKVSREEQPDDWPMDYRVQFWDAYPRKKAKKAAIKALDRIRKSGEVTFTRLMAGVQKIPLDAPVFIPHPATWLNDGRWDDEQIPGETNERSGQNRTNPTARPRTVAQDTLIAGMASALAERPDSRLGNGGSRGWSEGQPDHPNDNQKLGAVPVSLPFD